MRLLLVEDDEHVATALAAVLVRHGFDVTQARSGEEALERLLPAACGTGYDVLLLDLGLPDIDGFELCGRIRKVSSAPVIMVTARADVRSRIHGLNLGADDYVVKPYDTGELLARIHAVSRRSTGEEPAPDCEAAVGGTPDGMRRGPLHLDLRTRRLTVQGDEVALTRKEFDLLALLAARPGVVFRREQIISEVWHSAWEGTGRTLEVHVASLRGKIGLPVIETVRGVGYRFVPPAPPAPPVPPVPHAG